ncbi:MAG: Rieske 2Fe-2S domain-containing protein [Myxococcota bacterium]
MSVSYRAVQWNPQKKTYDRALAAGVVGSIAAFAGVGAALFPSVTAETLILRAVGTTAFLLLHLVLAIGPLCRLDPRFLPLLYNRRHMGVCMFTLALVHGGFSIVQFHALGDLNPLVSVLVSNPEVNAGLSNFPFQPFGLVALVILAVMAATSHDFWLANLTAPVWKAIHMSVYVAYVLLVAHVSLGVLQSEPANVYGVLLGLGVATIFALHVAAAFREAPVDGAAEPAGEFVEVGRVDEIEEGRAKIVRVAGERVAVFRYDGLVSAISNVCQHQNGPLGEGRVLDGCVTCPWHGYQYDPASGASPAPFEEEIPTFDVRLEGRRIFVSTRPNPPGTFVEPARIAVEA